MEWFRWGRAALFSALAAMLVAAAHGVGLIPEISMRDARGPLVVTFAPSDAAARVRSLWKRAPPIYTTGTQTQTAPTQVTARATPTRTVVSARTLTIALALGLAALIMVATAPRRRRRLKASAPRVEDTIRYPSTPDVAPTGARPFQLEATVAAGPRKGVQDYADKASFAPELGEDAAGIISYGDRGHFWWLCDGTTAGDFLPQVGAQPPLSTRLLARELGECFSEWCVSVLSPHAAEGANSVSEVLPALKRRWQARIDAYLAALGEEGLLEEFASIGAADLDGAFTLKWSTTFVGGALDPSSGGMAVFHAGDSGALVFRNCDGVRKDCLVRPTSVRIVVVANVNRHGAIRAEVSLVGAISTHLYSNVIGFAAMSDGIVKDGRLDDFLQRIGERSAGLSLGAIRAALISRADSSEDDKSLVFGRLV